MFVISVLFDGMGLVVQTGPGNWNTHTFWSNADVYTYAVSCDAFVNYDAAAAYVDEHIGR